MALTAQEKRERKVERTAERLRALSPGNQINDVARVFQKLVKLRAADDSGMIQCVTCEAKFAVNDIRMNAGHFISRKSRTTVFEFLNCHPQCVNCNKHLAGNLAVYRAWLVKTYSEFHVVTLEALSKTSQKWPVEELAEMKIKFLALCKDEERRLR